MRTDILQSSVGKAISDILIVVLLAWTVISFVHNNSVNGRIGTWGIQYNEDVSKAIITALVYCVGRLCFSIHFQWSRVLLYVILCALSLRELLFCISQFFYGHGSLTGTMGNTGLLGGLITVCMCILGAEIVKDGKYYRLLFLLPFLVLEIMTFSRAAWLSLAIVAFYLCLKSEPLYRWILRWKIPLLITAIFVGTLLYFLKRESADSRLFMGMIILRNFHKVGLLGVGPGNYCGFYGRSLFDYYQGAENSLDCVEALTKERTGAGIPDCAYNELLRVFVETGFVGVAIITAVSLLTLLRLYRINDSLFYGFLALIIFSMFSFPSRLPLFCCLFGILMAAGASISEEKAQNRFKPLYIVWSLLCFVAFVCLSKMRNEEVIINGFKNMQDFSNMGFYDETVKAGDSLYNKGYASPKFLLIYGQALRNIQEYEKSDEVINHGMEMSSNPSFWKVLGDNSVSKGDYLRAEKQYLHSFIMMPNRMQPMLDLARLYHTTEDTAKLSRIGDCAQRMIPKVENYKTRRMRDEIMSLKGDNK